MVPVALGGGMHHQKVAVVELHSKGFTPGPARPGAKPKGTGGPEAEGGDGMVWGQFGFIVRMPAHAVLAMAVAVEQEAVERHSEVSFELAAQAQQGLAPGERGLQQAAISVVATGIPDPTGEAGHQMASAVHPHHGLAPGKDLLQLLEQISGGRSASRPREALQPAGPMVQKQTRLARLLHRQTIRVRSEVVRVVSGFTPLRSTAIWVKPPAMLPLASCQRLPEAVS